MLKENEFLQLLENLIILYIYSYMQHGGACQVYCAY